MRRIRDPEMVGIGLFGVMLAFAVPAGLAAAGSGAVAPADAAADGADRVPLKTAVPQYPEKARRERLEGEVQVCFHIDRRGLPYRIAVRRSTHRLFERPAIDAVRASSYVPLDAGSKLPVMKTCRTFYFRLTPTDEAPASARMRPAASPSVEPKLKSPSS